MKYIDNIIKNMRSEVEAGATAGLKKAGKKVIIGSGIAGGVGSFAGAKLAHRKKKAKIKESNPMLFTFAIGAHSVLMKERGKEPNCLIQEGMKEAIARILGTGKRYKASVLSAETLGEHMYKNQKTMEQAIKLYGANSRTMKKAFPYAMGAVRKPKTV